MMKSVFYACYFSLVFFSSSTLLAQNKVVRPKKGEIVFTSETTIKDPVSFSKNMKEVQAKMIGNVLADLKAAKGTADSSILNQAEILKTDMPIQAFEPEEEKNDFYHLYEDSIIRSYRTSKNIMIGDYTLINLKKSTFVLQTKLDQAKIYTQPAPFVYSKNKAVKITEFRNEQKMINGYLCFKVIYQYKDDFEGDDILGSLTNNGLNTTEFWVTESIQSMFHPVCRVKEILKKYYPLEINEEIALFKGMFMSYKLKSISLSN